MVPDTKFPAGISPSSSAACFACTHCTKVLKSYKVHNEKYYCRECSTRMF